MKTQVIIIETIFVNVENLCKIKMVALMNIVEHK